MAIINVPFSRLSAEVISVEPLNIFLALYNFSNTLST